MANQRTITDRTGRESYHFDRVFDAHMNTEAIFDVELRQMVRNAISGYNVMIAAFG